MRARLLALASLLLAAPLPLAAQAGDSLVTIAGRVTDAVDRAGVAAAIVDVPGTGISLRSNGLGRFRITGVPRDARELRVRALGYAPATVTLGTASDGTIDVGDVVLERRPQVLSQMTVRGRSARVPHGFEDVYRRGLSGRGAFITREQIDSLNPIEIKSVLYAVPGLYVNQRGVYFNRCLRGQVGQLWVDGQRVTRFSRSRASSEFQPSSDPYFMNEYLTNIRPVEIQAIEVYASQSTVPAEFMDASPCAVIAVWTRRG